MSAENAVVDELVVRAAEKFQPVLPTFLHTLALAPITAETMLIGADGQVHLVRSQELDSVEMGVRFETACGERLWSDAETPLNQALRGGWQELEDATERCVECADHAADFPETTERHSDPEMPAAQALALDTAVRAQTRTDTLVGMEQLRNREPSAARTAVEATYRERLLGTAVDAAVESADRILDRVLRGTAEAAREDLRAAGKSDALGELFTREDWMSAVTNVLDDLQDDGDAAAARTFFYTELRAVLHEATRWLIKDDEPASDGA